MARQRLTLDTSVAVAGLVARHPDHRRCLPYLRDAAPLGAHAHLETVRVLTSLPRGLALPVRQALEVVRAAFGSKPTALPAAGWERLLQRLHEQSIGGGAVYDAVIAAEAQHAGLILASADRRANRTYAAVGVEVEWVG